MKVKKFTASTMPDAMKQVRKELGKNAVILNSRVVHKRGFLGIFRKKNIEVIAATDPSPLESKKAMPQKSIAKPDYLSYSTDKNLSGQKELRVTEKQILNEIKELKKYLNGKKESNEKLYPEPIQKVYRYLIEQELDPDKAAEVSNNLVEKFYIHGKNADAQKLKEWLKAELLTYIKPLPFGKTTDKKVIHLLGPTGVGKTTTVAKIAAEAVLNEKKKVALITTDTYRIAAVDQLKTYAKILNVPIEVAYNQKDFKEARNKFSDYDLILVDTAGRNYLDSKYIKQVKEMNQFQPDDEIHIVLSVTSKARDLEKIFDQFSELPIEKIIFTKIDETSQYGMMFNLITDKRVGVAYLTNGQDVPDDIIEANQEKFISTLVGELKDE